MDPRLATAFNWAATQLGKPYDHQESPQRFGPHKYDCSGFTTTFGVQLGQPHGSIPTSSGTIAAFFRTNPQYQLPVDVAVHTLGAMLIYGGLATGPAGHIVVVGPNNLTYESNGANGVCREPVGYLVDGVGPSDAGMYPVLVDNPEVDDLTPQESAQLAATALLASETDKKVNALYATNYGSLNHLHAEWEDTRTAVLNMVAAWNKQFPTNKIPT